MRLAGELASHLADTFLRSIKGAQSMYMLYLDDSGSRKDPKQTHFVLGGFAIHERSAQWLARELEKVVVHFFPGSDPSELELHGSPMMFGRKEWSGFVLEDRIGAMKSALDLINRMHKHNRVFAIAVDKPYCISKGNDPVETAFELIVALFDSFLHKLNERRIRTAKSPEQGIIIMDKSTEEPTMQSLFRVFQTDGHRFGKIGHLAETPLFLDSKASRLVQAADLIAYSVFRRLEQRNDRQFTDVFKSRLSMGRDGFRGWKHLAPQAHIKRVGDL